MTRRLVAMQTRAVAGVAPALNDAQVLAAIALASRRAASGPTTVVGIRNAQGVVYRVVHAVGVAESIALAAALEDLGLVDDECDLDAWAREGCDSVYAPRAHLRPRKPVDERLARHWADERRIGFLIDAGRIRAD